MTEAQPWDEEKEPKRVDRFVVALQIASTFTLLLIVFLMCYILGAYFTGYTVWPWIIGIALFGLAHVPIIWLIQRWFRSRLWIGLSLGSVIIMLIFPLSALLPGGVTYHFYGITLVGICPIPFADLTFDVNGNVGFRDKTENIHIDEINAMIQDDVEVLVIGTGWYQSARVDHRISDIRDVHIQIMSTPDAVDRYYELRSQGVRAALIMHTTE